MTKAKKAEGPLPPFKVEGLTVDEILHLDPDEINRMGKRDLSRALRTVALAANKRINRLRSHAKLSEGIGYLPKSGLENNIAMNALNAVTRDGTRQGSGKKNNIFGVNQAKGANNKETVNNMRAQLSEIRRFMSAKTSTISGATEVRQNREKKLLGTTTEEAIRGLSQKERTALIQKIESLTKDVYKGFRLYLEYKGYPNNPYEHFSGSTSVIELIKTHIDDGESVEEALKAAIDEDTKGYEAKKEEENNMRPKEEEGLNISGV